MYNWFAGVVLEVGRAYNGVGNDEYALRRAAIAGDAVLHNRSGRTLWISSKTDQLEISEQVESLQAGIAVKGNHEAVMGEINAQMKKKIKKNPAEIVAQYNAVAPETWAPIEMHGAPHAFVSILVHDNKSAAFITEALQIGQSCELSVNSDGNILRKPGGWGAGKPWEPYKRWNSCSEKISLSDLKLCNPLEPSSV